MVTVLELVKEEEDCKRMTFSIIVTKMCRNCVPLLTRIMVFLFLFWWKGFMELWLQCNDIRLAIIIIEGCRYRSLCVMFVIGRSVKMKKVTMTYWFAFFVESVRVCCFVLRASNPNSNFQFLS